MYCTSQSNNTLKHFKNEKIEIEKNLFEIIQWNLVKEKKIFQDILEEILGKF